MQKYTAEKFYHLLKIRFADCWDELQPILYLKKDPAFDDNDMERVICTRLDDNYTLANFLISVFSLYAGIILGDAERTQTFIGPAQHRARTIIGKDVNDAIVLSQDRDDSYSSQDRKACYDDLNQLGLTFKSAKKIKSEGV